MKTKYPYYKADESILIKASLKPRDRKLGRPFGSKDKGKRRKTGYFLRYQKDKQNVFK